MATTTLADVLNSVQGVKKSGNEYKALCPAHDDKNPSLSITEKNGKVLLYCHAGCSQQAVMDALGIVQNTPQKPKARTKQPLGKIVKVYDYTNADGTLVHQTLRYEPKAFSQCQPDPAKPGESLPHLRGITPVLYRLPEVLQAIAAGSTILICEGEKDADTAVELGYVATTCAMGAKKWRPSYSQTLHGADVIILPHQDTAGKAHALQVVPALTRVGCTIRVVNLPAKDLTEWVEAGHTKADIDALISQVDASTVETLHAQDDALTIVIGADIERMVDEGIAALATLPEAKRLYQRAGKLTMLTTGAKPPRGLRRPDDATTIAAVQAARIRELATTSAQWYKLDRRSKQYVEAMPPGWFAETVMARPSWPFPPLEGIISAPTMRPDGSILDQYGYDSETGLYFVTNGTVYPAMPHTPTFADGQAALTTLHELTSDFPFATAGHRSAAWAALLTMVARHAIQGNVPLFAIRSTTPGTGKGLLADALSIVALGRMSAKWTQGEEEEDRKRLLAIALEGDAVVCIDNVVRPLGSPALDAALTAGVIQDRVLGHTETRAVPLTAVFLATGNNLRFKGDIVRRVVPIDLDSKLERPEERTGFAHTPLKPWVQKERGRLLIAALTLLAAYTQAGRPAQGIAQYGSFEEWSDTVRSALIWAGEEDPCKGRAALAEESDSTYAALATLLDAWLACFPLMKNGKSVPRTLKQVTMEIDAKRPIPSAAPLAPYDKLLDALGDFDARYDGDRLNLKTVGMGLLKVEGRVLDNRRIRRGQRTTQGVPWHCEEVRRGGERM